ncbi:MAG: CHAT domain-containing protein, partial [Acidobacteria bacterium]
MVLSLGCAAPPQLPDGLDVAVSAPFALRRQPLAAGERQTFRLEVGGGEVLAATATQHGVDLALRILDPAGTELLSADGPYGKRGVERALVVSEAPAELAVEVEGAGRAGGAYDLELEVRPATAADRILAAAFRALDDGERARRRGDFRRAAGAFRRAADRARRAEDAAVASLAQHRLGQTLVELDRLPAALEAYRQARRLADAAGLDAPGADLAFGLGRLLLAGGDPAAAAAAWDEAAARYLELGEQRRAVLAINERARALEIEGRLDASRRAYRRAVELVRPLADPALEGALLNNLGWIHLRLGQPEVALDLFDQVLHLRRVSGDRRGEGITLLTRGTAERRLGRLEEARATLEEAHRLLLDAGEPPWIARALEGLGLTALAAGRLDDAERALRSSRSLLAEGDETRTEAMVILDLAEVELARRRGDAARALAAEALALFDRLADRQGQASAYFAIARAERLRGRLEAAWRFVNLAIEGMETVRASARIDPLRTAYLAFRREYYEHAVDLAVELGRRQPGGGWLEEAMAMSERGRARGLVEALWRARSAPSQRLDPMLLAREAEAEERLIALGRERARRELDGAAGGEVDALSARIRRASLALAEARSALRAADPKSAHLLRPPAFDARRFAGRLGDDTALIAIALGDERSHLLWLDRERLEAYDLPSRRRLDRLARSAHRGLEDSRKPRAAQRAQQALRQLSRLLLLPLADRLGDRRLVVVAEGALHYVPFAVLPDPRRLDDVHPPALLERHDVVSLPAASVLAALRSRPRHHPDKLLAVIADPVFSRDDPRLDGRGDVPAGDHEPLARLPFTADEAAAILALVPPGRGAAFLGFDANLELLTGGVLAGYPILHLATHGRLDAEHPELSGLELSRFDAAGRPRPATLYAPRIYDLELDAELVVLSACRTALGREIRGEGLVGLTRAFFHAGARRVVVSLWAVDDRHHRADAPLLPPPAGAPPAPRRRPARRPARAARHAALAGPLLLGRLPPPRRLALRRARGRREAVPGRTPS